MTYREHFAVERQDVIVIVSDRKSGIEFGWNSLLQVKPVKPSISIKDQRLAVTCPIWRLKGICNVIDDAASACGDIKNLAVAADILAIGHKVVASRNRDPDVFKDRCLHNVFVMRTNK